DTGEANNAARCGPADHIDHDRSRSGTFDDDVWTKIPKRTRVIGSTERLNKCGFCPALCAVEHVHLKTALRASQGRQQSHRPRTGYQRGARMPWGAPRTDTQSLLPRLRDHARRLKQDADESNPWIELDQKVGLDPKLLRAITIALLNAALGILAIAA